MQGYGDTSAFCCVKTPALNSASAVYGMLVVTLYICACEPSVHVNCI